MIAAGAWAGALDGLPAHARVPIRPVKGQIMRLRDPAGPGLLTRVIRMQPGYLVPRGDGRYVLGATMEEQGFDTAPTAGGIFELLRDAIELVPGVGELAIEEVAAGLRPGTPDNAPVLGPGALRRPPVGGRLLPPRDPARAGHRRRARRDARGRPAARGRRAVRRRALRLVGSAAGGAVVIAVQLNGEWRDLDDGATVADAVALLGVPLDARGVAVAVDREVVRRGAWEETALTGGARVEILTAIQGG